MNLIPNFIRKKRPESQVTRPYGRGRRLKTKGDYRDFEIIPLDRRGAQFRGVRLYRTLRLIFERVPIVQTAWEYMSTSAKKAVYQVLPVDESEQAKADAADLRDMMFGSLTTSISTLSTKLALHVFYGFSVIEWDGVVVDGVLKIRRFRNIPVASIVDFQFDEAGEVVALIQRTNEGDPPIVIPRWKVLYCVDDGYADSPRGRSLLKEISVMGLAWVRIHELTKAAQEENLKQIPVCYAPQTKLKEDVRDELRASTDTEEDAATLDERVETEVNRRLDQMLDVVGDDDKTNFYGESVDDQNASWSLLLDSKTYESTKRVVGDKVVSPARMWEVEYRPAIDTVMAEKLLASLNQDMARTLSVIGKVRGDDGKSSYALATQQYSDSWNWADQTIKVGVQALQRLATWVWTWNGRTTPCPILKVAESAELTMAEKASLLKDIADATNVLGPNDPALAYIRAQAGFPAGSTSNTTDDETSDGNDTD